MNPMEIEDSNNFESPCEDSENIYHNDEIEFNQDVFKGYRLDYLNDRDYSLNSPIISDDLRGFKNFLTSDTDPRTMPDKQKSWVTSKKWMNEILKRKTEDLNVSNFHRYLGKILLRRQIKLDHSEKFLKSLFDKVEETRWVPAGFVEGVFPGETVPKLDLPKLTYLSRFFSIFFTFHWITQLMNAKDQKERTNLASVINKEMHYVLTCHDDHYEMSTPIGKYLFNEHYLIDRDNYQMMSHQHVLLIKDLSVARFNSVLYISCQIDPLFEDLDLDRMIKIYKLGDECLIDLDNLWYDHLALLEPLCNLRLVETSQKYRELIPIDPSFGEFVRGKISNLSSISPKSKEFFEEIDTTTHLGELLHLYGIFRHWGHPEIDYLAGLEKLHTQVQMDKKIDESYASALASDLAFIVLRKKFKRQHKWFVDTSRIESKHLLYNHFKMNTFPSDAEILLFGDHWHELPLVKCFDIPEVIDPSLIYSDKSHSKDYNEVKADLTSKKIKKIPSLRVLQSYLNKENTNWKSFLKKIDEEGLPEDSLIIGLKAKEREIKRVGRFFALMSWELREYFVITEYLIKEHFVPLFGGLTMADDFSTVTRKMLDRSAGQGVEGYTQLCYANHIDYEKWNNHQRRESTSPVFKVMGQFLGYPNLIARTHEFFEKSFIYYNNRADLMELTSKGIIPKGHERVCWQGQKGGLEGLRQKGWSILNLLIIRREARLRSTKVSVLAQGDNQVVCTQYKVQKCLDELEVAQNLMDIHKNNKFIMDQIVAGTKKLGLIINESETIQGSDYLNYGKVPIWRGNICPLPTKRWSRVCCVTNDQLPSMGSMMATVVTNALTVANFSATPIPSIIALNLFGNLVFELIKRHNPAIRNKMEILAGSEKSFRIGFLYLDPALGGISGANLNRFLIRSFPDPVTESLSFWKIVATNTTDPENLEVCRQMADVRLKRFDIADMGKLLENPTSLNLIQGVSAETTIKEHIKKELTTKSHTIKNSIVRDILVDYEREEEKLHHFLFSINPLFPRFLSEFKASSFIGICDGLIGLFQNSRTIRQTFRTNFRTDINKLIIEAEMIGITTLNKINRRFGIKIDQLCTSNWADQLRLTSWGRTVHGATIPHPSEMFNLQTAMDPDCSICNKGNQSYIITRPHFPSKDKSLFSCVGPHPPYLGSATTESTSILSPWEQESKIGVIVKAKNLRRSIGWFTNRDTNLSKSILTLLQSLTGVEWKDLNKDFKRTGSALHRFSSERQSAGGFNAISPTALSRLYSTTDLLRDFQESNFDFMFQSTILFVQASLVPYCIKTRKNVIFHHHLKCQQCVREIGEIILDTPNVYEPRDVSSILSKWKPDDSKWIIEKPTVRIPIKSSLDVSPVQRSYAVGRIQGFAYGLMRSRDIMTLDKKKLFPQALSKKIYPEDNLRGLLDGIIRASALHLLQRRLLYNHHRPREILMGACLDSLNAICLEEALLTYISSDSWFALITSVPHRVPPSYPPNKHDSSYLILNYLHQMLFEWFKRPNLYKKVSEFELSIFSDFNTEDVTLPMAISDCALRCFQTISLTSEKLKELRIQSDRLSQVYNEGPLDFDTEELTKNIYLIGNETRHAIKDLNQAESIQHESVLNWGVEYNCGIHVKSLKMVTSPDNPPDLPFKVHPVSPLMSGLRLFQFATGSHYKVRSIIEGCNISFTGFACLGDGSGGLTSMCLRMNPLSRGLFNSLLNLIDTPIHGQEPGSPSAILCLGKDKYRCVNLGNVTVNPSDLTLEETWKYLINQKQLHSLHIDLVIIDCELQFDTRIKIEKNILKYIKDLLDKRGVLLYKTYLSSMMESDTLQLIFSLFPSVDVIQTDMTSTYSEEVYIKMEGSVVQPRRRFVQWSSFEQDLMTFAPYRSSSFEFGRCLKLRNVDLYKGVPRTLIYPPDLSLGDTLASLGTPIGMSYSISKIRRRWNINDFIGLICVSSYFTFRSASKAQSHLKPPSDSVTVNLLSQLFGFAYFMCWRFEDQDLFDYLNRQLYRKTPLFIGKIFKRRSDKIFFQSWSLSSKSNIWKSFYMCKEKSKITKFIRALVSLDYREVSYDESEVNGFIKEFIHHLDLQFFVRNTGVLDLTKQVFIPLVLKLSVPASEPIEGVSIIGEI